GGEPGRDRLGAIPFRRGCLCLSWSAVCRGKPAAPSVWRTAAARHPRAWTSPVQPPSHGLWIFDSLRGHCLVSRPYPRRANLTGGGGVSHISAFSWLQRAPDSSRGGTLWRKLLRSGGGLHVAGLHPALGGRHGCRPRVDCFGSGRIRYLASLSSYGRCLLVRRHHHSHLSYAG